MGNLELVQSTKQTSAPNRPPKHTLDWLAQEINQECDTLALLMERALHKAIYIGELMIEAKDKIGHGKFEAWCEINIRIPASTRRGYMNLAKNRTEIEEGLKNQGIEDATITEALELLAANATRPIRYRTNKDPKQNGYLSDEDMQYFTSTDVWDLADPKWTALERKWATHFPARNNTSGARSGVRSGNAFYVGKFSVFSPTLSEAIYRRYAGNAPKNILDPCTGGAVRGFVAASLGYNYFGVDIRAEQIEENYQHMKHDPGVTSRAHYVEEDARNIGQTDFGVDGFDFALTCPPYFDREVYSDDPRDLSKCPNYDEFNEAMQVITKGMRQRMKAGAFVCIVVGFPNREEGKLIDLRGDTVINLEDAGFQFWQEISVLKRHGTGAMRARRLWNQGKHLVPRHESLLVFKTPQR